MTALIKLRNLDPQRTIDFVQGHCHVSVHMQRYAREKGRLHRTCCRPGVYLTSKKKQRRRYRGAEQRRSNLLVLFDNSIWRLNFIVSTSRDSPQSSSLASEGYETVLYGGQKSFEKEQFELCYWAGFSGHQIPQHFVLELGVPVSSIIRIIQTPGRSIKNFFLFFPEGFFKSK